CTPRTAGAPQGISFSPSARHDRSREQRLTELLQDEAACASHSILSLPEQAQDIGDAGMGFVVL
ncbi:MAG: hypothetical protein IJP54_08320, partial [Synergistaceae bacterium]|nr:hypothetical protein [Synergistaceae bacterium]